jgi:hypothetical protein
VAALPCDNLAGEAASGASPFGTGPFFPRLDLTLKDISFAGGANTVERSLILNTDSAGAFDRKKM